MLRFKHSTWGQIVFVVAVTAGLSASGAAAAADATSPLTKQQVKALIKTAKTPEDHMKLARYYWYEADMLKSEAKEHEEMGAEYINRIAPKNPTMSQHCKDLSNYVTKAAQKAEQLAAMHEEMAKSAAK